MDGRSDEKEGLRVQKNERQDGRKAGRKNGRLDGRLWKVGRYYRLLEMKEGRGQRNTLTEGQNGEKAFERQSLKHIRIVKCKAFPNPTTVTFDINCLLRVTCCVMSTRTIE